MALRRAGRWALGLLGVALLLLLFGALRLALYAQVDDEERLCVGCGSHILPRFQFCPHCGANQAGEPTPVKKAAANRLQELQAQDNRRLSAPPLPVDVGPGPNLEEEEDAKAGTKSVGR